MKKTFVAAMAAFSLTLVIFSGCKKDDTEAPVITILGNNPFTLTLNTAYSDPGATAEDNEDGNVTASIVTNTSEVNKDLVGSYGVHYEVSDAAGNFADAHRTVNVVNSLASSPWTGSYSVVITHATQPTYNYNESLAISTTRNNHLEFSKFGDYSNATAKLNISITGTQVDVPAQSFTAGTPAVNRQFSGSGTLTGNGSAGSTMVLTITETVNSVSDNFTYTYTKL